jgi:hypothetical protein
MPNLFAIWRDESEAHRLALVDIEEYKQRSKIPVPDPGRGLPWWQVKPPH